MQRIFKKDFKFSVESYEEYQKQECISSGDIDAAIYCHVVGERAHFLITGMDELKIDREFSFNLNHPFSNIHDVDEEMVTSPRIQYLNDSLGTDTEPYICHLFCRFGQIVKVRFGFADFNASNLFPWPKRIYEFFGDMEELGELSQESEAILAELSTSKSVLLLNYDKYCVMVDTSDYNPFNIITDEQLNKGHIWSSMIDDFEKELMEIMPRCIQKGINLNKGIHAYIFNLVETIFNSKGYVPKVLVDAIINDVYSAVLRTPYSFYIEDIDNMKYAVYYNFTHH